MEKKQIFVATKTRGYFKPIFNEEFENFKFVYDDVQLYNKKNATTKYKIISKLGYSIIADILGVIQTIDVKNKDYDFFWSYNRLLKTDKPYVLYVEHPLALFHYRILRQKCYIGRKKVMNYLADPKLKAIVFQAKFSLDTFDDICPGYTGKKFQIYPMTEDNPDMTREDIFKRCKEKKLKILFVAQASRFVSKCGPELIEAVKRIDSAMPGSVELTMLTQTKLINQQYVLETSKMSCVRWLDYNLTSEEMNKLYAENMLFVLVSSDDSINAAAQEAMKAGVPVISSNMAGFTEIVEEGVNGYMTDPKWWFFGKDKKPNPKVWNHRKKTIYSENLDERIIEFMCDKINYLNGDREELVRLSLNAYDRMHNPPFSREYISRSWKEVLDYMNENVVE